MESEAIAARVAGLRRRRGGERRTLRVAGLALGFEGLDTGLAAALDRRFGPFLDDASDPAAWAVEVLDGGASGWLPTPSPGERYRLEHAGGAETGIVSYAFALLRSGALWRLGLAAVDAEPLDRSVENAARYLLARWCVERGGFAMHGAGIVLDGRAFVFAGPSRAGKSTAVGLVEGGRSLGDDFAVALPDDRGGWSAAAVPFDNAECVVAPPVEGRPPLTAILRLHQSDALRIERPPRSLAAASLMACAAFPWALPDLADRLLAQVESCAAAGRVVHLHFPTDRPLGDLLTGL